MSASDASIDFLAAILSTLAGDTTLAGLVGASAIVTGQPKIFSRPPAEENMPFIEIGDISDLDDSADNSFAQWLQVDIAVWHQYQSTGNEGSGVGPALTMAARIRALLHENPVTIANGRNIVIQRVINQRILQEPDGLTNRVIVTVKALVGHS